MRFEELFEVCAVTEPHLSRVKMNKLFDSCSGCPSCFNADLLISPQVLQYWEEKVQHA